MKYLTILIAIMLLPMLTFGQDAEKIYPYTEIEKSGDFYKKQRELWKAIIDKSPKNAEAWYNYYLASRYARAFGGEKGIDLNEIAKATWEAIPNTFEGNYIMYSSDQWNPEKENYLLQAYEIAPSRYETYHSLINKYVMEFNDTKVSEFFGKLYEKGKYSTGALAWNYNLLQSVEENAILITYGDNDTYPAWMLQYGKGIRKDVSVLNIHLMGVGEYTKALFEKMKIPEFEGWTEDAVELHQKLIKHIIQHSNRPVYIATTNRPTLREAFKDNLFLTGLAYKYAESDFDNIATIQNNYENRFAMDYIHFDLTQDKSQSIVDKMNMAYTSSMLLLYKHFKNSGEEIKAKKLEKAMLKILKANNREEEFKKYFE